MPEAQQARHSSNDSRSKVPDFMYCQPDRTIYLEKTNTKIGPSRTPVLYIPKAFLDGASEGEGDKRLF
jgi:hypothetical protein